MNARSPTNLSWNLRLLRHRVGLNQAQLAIRVGCRNNVISQIEVGRIEPTLRIGARLAEILGVTVDTLLGERLPPC
jgi:DNA-binding XRE family transcriptional regulator